MKKLYQNEKNVQQKDRAQKKKKRQAGKRDFRSKLRRKLGGQEEMSEDQMEQSPDRTQKEDSGEEKQRKDQEKEHKREDTENHKLADKPEAYGEKVAAKVNLTDDTIKSGESQRERDDRYSTFMLKGNLSLAVMKKKEEERVRKIHRECLSEDKLEMTQDYQRLVGASSRLIICNRMKKFISKYAGDSHMESAFAVTQNRRRVELEIRNLHHTEFTIKRRYLEVSPDTGARFMTTLKAKSAANTTYQFREHSGGFVDQET